ncbi:unnamed protein product, partial [Owenia fusiformis]
YMSTTEARDKFLLNPVEFLPKDKPLEAPPVRLFIMGPKGSGKSLHGRHLARKLGLFHIKFRDRLQELIIAKTKKKIGPEYEEDNEEEEEEEEPESAITNPDGTPMKEEEKEGVKTDEEKAEATEPEKTEAEEEKKEEEEEEVELTEDEEAIKSNLADEEPLGEEVLNNIVPQWWNKEPFKSTGFVLEGFPRTQDEVRYLGELGLFPDAA